MATDEAVRSVTKIAGEDLSSSQFHAIDSDGTRSGAATTGFFGVIYNKPGNTQAAQVAQPGSIAKVKAGAAFADDTPLTTDATGRFVAATTGQRVCAISQAAAGAADEIVRARIEDGLSAAP